MNIPIVNFTIVANFSMQNYFSCQRSCDKMLVDCVKAGWTETYFPVQPLCLVNKYLVLSKLLQCIVEFFSVQ